MNITEYHKWLHAHGSEGDYQVYFVGQHLSQAPRHIMETASAAYRDSQLGHVMLFQKKLGYAQYEYRVYKPSRELKKVLQRGAYV